MEETLLCHHDIAYKNTKIKEYMNRLISKNNNQRCECCPYGYHVNLDFVEFAKDLSNSRNELQKIRRYQRKLERAQNNVLQNRDGAVENIRENFTAKKSVASESISAALSNNNNNNNRIDFSGVKIDNNNDFNFGKVDNNNEFKASIKYDNKNDLNCEKINNKNDCNCGKIDNKKDFKASIKSSADNKGDIFYISNNAEEYNYNNSESRSSDESILQSPSPFFQSDLNNSNNSKNIFAAVLKESEKNGENEEKRCKNTPSSSKSFVVSLEHLLGIREQMSVSLRRVQELEAEAEAARHLRRKYEALLEENRQLQQQLAQHALNMDINCCDNGKIDFKNVKNDTETTEVLENRPLQWELSQKTQKIDNNCCDNSKINTETTQMLENKQLQFDFSQETIKTDNNCCNNSKIDLINMKINTNTTETLENKQLQYESSQKTKKIDNNCSIISKIDNNCCINSTIDNNCCNNIKIDNNCYNNSKIDLTNVKNNPKATQMFENKQSQYESSQKTKKIDNNVCKNSKTDLTNLKINTEATKWETFSDVPSEILPNLERILEIKFPQSVPKSLKSRFTQTDVNGNLILDTFSYLTNSNSENLHSQKLESHNLKIQRRNFGVTVRPTHHHFTQQISFPSPKSFKPDESMSTFHNFIAICDDDLDRNVGILIYNILNLFFKVMYRDAVDLLKQELLTCSTKYKTWNSTHCQTLKEVKSDISTQVTSCEYYHHRGVQAQPVVWNKHTNTREFSTKDNSMETERIFVKSVTLETNFHIMVDTDTQTDFMKSRSHMNDISSTTDRNLIDDLISEHVENSIDLIYQELRVEFELRSKVKDVNNILESNENESTYLSNVYETKSPVDSETGVKSSDEVTCSEYELNMKKGASISIYREHRVDNLDSQLRGDILERSSQRLVRTKINCLDFSDEKVEDINNNMYISQSSILKVDTDLRNSSMPVEESGSDSAGSSPLEGCYYTADRHVDYHNINQIDEEDEAMEENVESVTETEKNLTTNTDKVSLINQNVIKQEDIMKEYQFPESISHACSLVALWMNDSTTTNSKDLNDSLAVIRQFWFGITKDNNTNIKFFIDKFKTFNSTLHERIINMTDSNGNSCLHYAVSEGRWSIVRQILETEQVDVSRTNKAGYTILMLAAVSDVLDEDVIKLLISKSEIDKQSTNDARQTALMIAASQGKTQLVQWLLEASPLINVTDSDGSSALMCACDNGHLEVVRLFLSRMDIDTELEDKAGSNAMKIALDNSHKDIALLIFARNNLHKGSLRFKRHGGQNSHPTSPLSQRKFK